MRDFDVVVVGAGTAGAAAAADLAGRGLRTLCIDRRPLNGAGATWVNAVPRWAFDDAGIEPPRGDELLGEGHRFNIVCGYGPEKITLDEHGVLEVDMRLLVARLHALAAQRGATLEGETSALACRGDVLDTSAGPVRARWIVDASGLAGSGLFEAPPVAREDLCVAAQEVREVNDPVAARAFFARHGVEPGDTLCFTGIAGGFSIINVRLDGEQLSILCGSIPAFGNPSGQKMLDQFVASNPFIGPKRFGGARAIPLARPRERLVRGNVIALGDVAGQVFSAHGSGIGAGLVAARMLGEALAAGRPYDYAARWQRRFGGTFAAYDVFRRFSQTLTEGDLRELMRAGLIDSDSATAAMQQRFPSIGLTSLVARLQGAAAVPRLAMRFGPMLARMAALLAFYRTYPSDERLLDAWISVASRL
ncbi:MAG: FAD-binding protein [Myxococcales bacterium]|nr:FAD-binding protein [Myxococcales bacterium]